MFCVRLGKGLNTVELISDLVIQAVRENEKEEQMYRASFV